VPSCCRPSNRALRNREARVGHADHPIGVRRASGTVWQFEQASGSRTPARHCLGSRARGARPATPVADATAGGEEAWFTSAPATLTRPVVPWAGRAGGGRDHRDGAIDVGGERRAGDAAGCGGQVGVAGAVAGGAGGVGRVAIAGRRVAVAGGAVHRRVGVPGDGGSRGAGERRVCRRGTRSPSRTASGRRPTSSGPSRSSRRACPRPRRPSRWRGACRWRPGSGRDTPCREASRAQRRRQVAQVRAHAARGW